MTLIYIFLINKIKILFLLKHQKIKKNTLLLDKEIVKCHIFSFGKLNN